MKPHPQVVKVLYSIFAAFAATLLWFWTPPAWHWAAVYVIASLAIVATGAHLHRSRERWRSAYNNLDESEKTLRLILGNIADMFFSLDPEGRFLAVNLKAEKYFAKPASELIGKIIWEVFPAVKSAVYFHQYFLAMRDRKLVHAESPSILIPGRWVEGYAFPVGNQLDIYFRDITDRKLVEKDIREMNASLETRVVQDARKLEEKEKELVRARRVEAIGQLASGLAHDFNNLVTGIMGITLDVQKRVKEDLDQVMDASRRASGLSRQLLAFGRRQPGSPRSIQLNEIITGMLQLLKKALRENITLKTELDPALANVRVDQAQFEQILMNMVLNSRDALLQGGQISIQTQNTDLSVAEADRLKLQPGPHVVLVISDNGSGMDEETARHIFEPFYSTKDDDKGTGMGLAVVFGIVEQHGGTIAVDSQPGQGAIFKIILPVTTDPVVVERLSPPRTNAPTGSETILLAEDEDIVRRVAARALRDRGYHVLEARSGDETLRVAEEQSGAIDLLLTDMMLLDMTGRQIADSIRQRHPALAVLYMSGHSPDLLAERGLLNSDAAFLEKPFSGDSLSHKVREVLDQSH